MNAILFVGKAPVEAEPCSHCGAKPDQQIAADAVRQWEADFGPYICVVCEQAILPIAFMLHHNSDTQSPHWIASPRIDLRELTLTIGMRAIKRRYFIHIECALRAMPGIDPKALEIPRSPWEGPATPGNSQSGVPGTL